MILSLERVSKCCWLTSCKTEMFTLMVQNVAKCDTIAMVTEMYPRINKYYYSKI